MANSEILGLLERPLEPVFIPKGQNFISYEIHPEHLPDRFRPFETEIFDRIGNETGEKVPIKQIVLPDMTVPKELKRSELFSLFSSKHQEMAGHLIDIFMSQPTFEDFLAVAASSRDLLNPQLYFYALSVAILHRQDTKHLKIPSIFEVFPGQFFDSTIFNPLTEQAHVVSSGSRMPIDLPGWTATDLDPEHRLAYFREDIGINSHHWHWHLLYPYSGPLNVVNKDRRGELFYYMHHQILARYQCDRLALKMGRIKKMNNLRATIPEAYFPKLTSLVSGKPWGSRPSGLTLKDVNRPHENSLTSIDNMERYLDRIFQSIHKGYVTNERGEKIPLSVENGIDILGNIIEASILSVNKNLYGDIHNQGHEAISTCHDPDYRYLEPVGVMGNTTTAMRDPVFYRWHGYMNDIFLTHKYLLPPYTVDQLNYSGIAVSGCHITTANGPDDTLETFWSKSNIDIGKGLDFKPHGPIPVRVTHLNHAKFQYEISAINNSNSTRTGTVRIFIGPKNDERELPFDIRAQLELMIEMDKFTVTLQPGLNVIVRSSTDSTITIPYETVFRDLGNNRTAYNTEDNFCLCGWPQYMLVPRGRSEGLPMHLFVMITNHDLDYVPQPGSRGCKNATSFCGLRDRKYPDSRAMGFPFDRRERDGVKSLEDFLTPNMALMDILIKFSDKVISRSKQTS